VKPRPEDLADPDRANALFLAEVEMFALRYRCEACVHVVPSDRSCSLGYPNAALVGPPGVITDDGALAFCRYFELGEGHLG